ncbi:MAG: HAMP domain-containing sensor histidine kinase [Acidimicrobiales bacterium]
MPIRIRLALLSALVATVLVMVGGLVFTRQLHAGLLHSVDVGLRNRADQLVSGIDQYSGDSGVDFNDQTTRLIGPREALAQVVGPDGSVIESSEALRGESLLSARNLARARRATSLFTATVGADQLRLLAAPVARPDGTWVAVVGSSLSSTTDAVTRVRQALLVVGGGLGVVWAGLGSWILAGAALRPVERMRREVADISEHDPSPSIAVPATRDELAALAATMNDVLSRLQTALARERRLVADAGHELRTPLAVLRMELELAGRPGRRHDELVAAIAAARDEVERLARLAENLLFLARRDEGELVVAPVRQALRPLLEVAVAAAGRVAPPRVTLTHDHADLDGEPLQAVVDADQLRRAVDNLLDNALRYAPAGTTVTVRSWAEGPDAVVEVSDKGPGFPPEFVDHAFERFRRADKARARRSGGAGLGLAIVKAVAEAHGGHAEAHTADGGGARVRLVVPRHPVGH